MSALAVAKHGPAARLRADSADIHRRTEDEPFIVDLMAGRREIADYVTLVVQLRSVYAALEAEVTAARPTVPAVVADLFDPRLERSEALDHDLRVLSADAPGTLREPLPETLAYVATIQAAASSWPRLLAHHYVRYLGDLSGGQIVADRLRRHYAVGDAGLTFYAFDTIGSKGGFKTRYREALDTVLADDVAYAETLDETIVAYAANRAIFAALA